MCLKSIKINFSVAAFGLALLQVSAVQAASFTSLEKMSLVNAPASVLHKQRLKSAPSIIAEKLDLTALNKEDKANENQSIPYRFAVPMDEEIDYDKRGQWEVKGETAIWRVRVTSADAKSFNFGLKNVFIPKGGKIFFYSDDYSTVLGPFTEKDNKSHGQLWTPAIESNNVTMEINVPAKLQSFFKFDIAKISQGYRNITSAPLTKSGGCNNDVVCSEADSWRNEIRSVARILISGAGWCSGTLMNNARGDFKPYFLSAGHCGVGEAEAASLVFYWNFETSFCQGSPDGREDQFSTGATFRAASSVGGVVGSDFVIVELDTAPEADFNVYWSGWDNSSDAPSSAVGIHHPKGHEKRISFDDNALTITDYGSSIENSDESHLRVGAWDDGTTEGGSSGSGIWNAAHHLVGTLSGGSASCAATGDPDWYGRMSVHWEGGGTAETQVKTWLDPDNSGAVTLDGVNGCEAPTVAIDSSATSQLGEETLFAATVSGGAGGYQYLWDFNNDGNVDSTEASPSYIYDYLYQGSVKVTVNDSASCPAIDSTAIVVTSAEEELFPINNTIPSEFNLPAGADAGWGVESNELFEGGSSLKSATISNSQNASTEVTQEFSLASDNFVSFAYKTSTEEGYDFLKFYIDGVEKAAWSGERDWTTVYFALEAGERTLSWSYEKDSSDSAGSDAAWIDGVTGITISEGTNRAPVASIASATLSVNEGASVSLDASSSTDPESDELSYSWVQISGTDVSLSDATGAVATFTAPEVSNNTTLEFEVTVTATGGSDSKRVTVTVNNVAAPTTSSGSGGGSINAFLLGLFVILLRRKK